MLVLVHAFPVGVRLWEPQTGKTTYVFSCLKQLPPPAERKAA